MTAVRREVGQTRVAFRHGARLASRDLQADSDHERRLHGLHVRALHDTWGVALGYEAAPDATRREVRVGPGLAYDCDGDELLLADAIAVPGPTGGDTEPVVFDLVLRAARPLTNDAARARASVCIASAGPLAVAIRWVRAGAGSLGDRLPLLAPGVRLGRDVPLGRFVRAPDGTLDGPDPSICRRVRPLLRPHIGVGRAPAYAAECDGLLCTIQVDTRGAGFSDTPHYFASIDQGSLVVSGADDLLIGPFVSLAEAEAGGFTLQLVFALRPSPITDTTALEAAIRNAVRNAQVEWTGLEPFGGCPPDPAGRLFFRLGGRLIGDFTVWPGLFEVMAMAGGVS
jgi:hypothetical protein